VLQTGDILVGRYEVDSLLGRGGMSRVYSAFDRSLGRDVAVKVLAAELLEDEVFVERFDREARAAASLSHRNVVAVFDSGVDGGSRFIVMERISGRTLSEVLGEGPLPVERVVEIALGVAKALGAAHARGVVHRDVKPSNVMVGDDWQVKVLDFGIARALAASSLTRATTVIGTAGYLSPEQANGGPIDGRSDLYGLGCVTYEMLAGRPPFIAESAAALVDQHATRPPERPSRLRPEVSAALDEVVLRCLAKDPEGRYDSARALCAALAEVPPSGNGGAAGGAAPTRVLSGARWRRPAPPLPTRSAKRRARWWRETPAQGRAHAQRGRRWLAAPAAVAVLVVLLLLLDHGSGGRPGGAAARASVPSKHAAASAPQRAATSGTTDPAAAAAALDALLLSDQRLGLIDERAASVISRRTATLLNDGSSGDPSQTARQLSDFGRRLDALAHRGDVSSPATAIALKVAAAELANVLIASSRSNAETSPSGGVAATDGEGPARAGRDTGGGGHHDGPAPESQD
jgi:tRNA A-37 threonylcarbamoyl transferase component Bud32